MRVIRGLGAQADMLLAVDWRFSSTISVPMESLIVLFAGIFTYLKTDQKSTLAFLGTCAWGLAMRFARVPWW